MFLCTCTDIFAQSTVDGIVTNSIGKSIENVHITTNTNKNTISAKDGKFSIDMPIDSTTITLRFSCIGYKTKQMKIYNGETNITVVLSDSISELNEVIVMPYKYGRFSNYEAQITKMNSFEIKTNPNALGDIIGGMKVMPGVQTNDNDGRLIIQGGNTDESQIYIDGLIYFNPYSLSQKNVSARSRFSPDLFTGVSLQSAGFSAAYGNALSGILQLDSYNANQMISKTDINVNTTGAEASLVRANDNFACRANVSYMNLSPYYKIVKGDYDLNKAYNNLALNYFMINHIKKKSVVKTNLYYNQAAVNYSYNNIDNMRFTNDLWEKNFLGSVIGDFYLNEKWNLYAGANLAYYDFSNTDAQFKSDSVHYRQIDSHMKIKASYHSGKITNSVGVENIYSDFDENYFFDEKYKLKYRNNLISIYDVFSIFPSDKINFNCGLRYEYSTYLKRQNFAPRVYASYKINRNNILSLSSGIYYQMPKQTVLGYTDSIGFRNAFASTVSYNFVKNSSKLQVDLYYKKYYNLTTYDRYNFYYNNFNDKGSGNTYGANVFWKSTMRNFEYWLSYSYVNANIFSDLYCRKVMPEYLSHNRFGATAKYWIKQLHSMIGASFVIDDGATFYKDDNSDIYVKSPNRNKLDLSWSYVPTQNLIVHFSCQNVFGRRNVYGYEYSSVVSDKSRAIVTPEKRFFYIGVFITLSKHNINQLKSL